MSEYRKMIERLRELYLHCDAERTTRLSQQDTINAVIPGLSTAKITAEEKQYCYYHGFLAGMQFFQSCIQQHPKPLASFITKEGDRA